MSDLDMRRRRAAYRAAHRGTKEMDWLLGRYAEAHLDGMDAAALSEFEALMELPEPDLQRWLMAGDVDHPSQASGIIERIRAFHGLGAPTGASIQ